MTARPLKLSDRQAAAINSDLALKMLSVSSDLTLLIGEDDVIRDVSFPGGQSRLDTAADWIGRRWSDVVTSESRPKVEALLREARAGRDGPARQVNHPHPDGVHIPLLYSAVELDSTDEVIALARDMTPISQMQQRLVRAQQALERDYARLLEMERRYRTLFQVTTNGVLMVDAATAEILEANPAAVEMLAPGALRINGRRFPEGFERASAQALTAAMALARADGSAQDIAARLSVGEAPCRVSLNLFHEAGAPILLVRIIAVGAEMEAAPGERGRLMADCLQASPDAFVAAGADGRILHANPAFVSMAEAPGEEAVRRHPLDRHFGRSGVDLEVLLAGLRNGGSIRAFSTVVRGEQGRSTEVEVSAVRLPDRGELGLFVHDVDRRLDDEGGASAGVAAEQAAELVGRMPLKDIVGRTSDVIEELCIRRALELTTDNRAAAAELLGLSRQTLYAKLRRLGIDEAAPDDEV